jgi:Uma2 family endonuclease
MSAAVALPKPGDDQWLSGEEQRFVVFAVPWKSYVAIGEALLDRNVFMNYDRGTLELMTKSLEHESYLHLLVALVMVWVEEFGIPVRCFGSATQQRADLERGFEPDACFYFKNLAKMRGKKRLDLTRDPAPDLAIEVEVSRGIVDRISLYAATGIRELWRFDGKIIRPYRLVRGRYGEAKDSLNLPGFPFEQAVRLVHKGIEEDDTTAIREFRRWIREKALAQ